jgi:hypothetical protein
VAENSAISTVGSSVGRSRFCDLRRQRQIAPQLFLLQVTLVQAPVLDQQREDAGCTTQELSLVLP